MIRILAMGGVVAGGVLVCGLVSCGERAAAVSTSGNLTLAGEFDLEIPEPSGLCLGADGKSLWMVSDDDGCVYRTDLEGKVLSRFETGLRDLEGIATVDGETVAVLAEREREIVVFSNEGKLLRRGKIGLPGDDNYGPEGLSYDRDAREFVVVNEVAGLLIRMDEEFRESSRKELRFAQDYSSITVDAERDELWVMSDLSGSIYLLTEQLDMVTSFSTNIQQLEGIAVDHANHRIYVVSDPLSRLYVMDFEDAADL
jgi:uncharacterized protein YjiK